MKLQANAIWLDGKRLISQNGDIVLTFQAPDETGKMIDQFITRSMFFGASGPDGCPPLVKITPVQGMVGITHSFSFVHIWIDATGMICLIKGELLSGKPLNSSQWSQSSFQPKYQSPNDRFLELAAKWIEFIDKEGYAMIFPQDEDMGGKIYALKSSINAIPNLAPTAPRSIIDELNGNFRLADSMTTEELEKILKEATLAYSNSIDEPESMLEDKIFDYIEELYKVKLTYAGIEYNGIWGDAKQTNSGRRVVDNGMSHVPTPIGRMLQLPVWMGSMSKVNKGTGQLPLWKDSYPGPYIISWKMDGGSALLFEKDGQMKLYSRGKDGQAQDISEVLDYLHLEKLEKGFMIRGELILKKSDFNNKYRRTQPKEKGKYRNGRNAVGGGLINKIGCRAAGSKSSGDPLEVPFIDDIQFVVYEVITTPPMKCSDQFAYLESKFGKIQNPNDPNGPKLDRKNCSVAPHFVLNEVSDEILSPIYHKILTEADYDIDGLIVCSDHVYERPNDSNPSYARAYKEALASLTRVTKIVFIEWNVSKDGYLIPRVMLEPVEVDGVRVEYATGNNAQWVIDMKWGPGALVEVVRSGSVIPKITKTLVPATEFQGPTQPYIWDKNHVHLILDPTVVNPEAEKAKTVKKLRHFLKKIGVKGIGPETVLSLFGIGLTKPEQFFALRIEHVAFMGPKAGENVVTAIQAKSGKIPLPALAAASGVFERGLGKEYFKILFDLYPQILESHAVKSNNVEQLRNGLLMIHGFGEERARLMAIGLPKFIDFLSRLQACGYPITTVHAVAAPKKVEESNVSPLTGMKITLTGFHRDEVINGYLEKVGAIVQSMKKDTKMLIIKDDSYRNNKTTKAEADGIQVISAADFKQKYVR